MAMGEPATYNGFASGRPSPAGAGGFRPHSSDELNAAAKSSKSWLASQGGAQSSSALKQSVLGRRQRDAPLPGAAAALARSLGPPRLSQSRSARGLRAGKPQLRSVRSGAGSLTGVRVGKTQDRFEVVGGAAAATAESKK